MAKLRGPQGEFEQFMGECLRSEDPIVSRFVSEHEAFRARNEALVERVAVLERALERVANWDYDAHPEDAWRVATDAQEALDG